MGNGGKQTWKRVRGRRVEGSFALSSKPRPVTIFSSSLFFVLHFQLFMVYVQLEQRALLALCYWSAGTDLVVLTFQLLLDFETVIFFFLSCFLSFIFFLCQFLSYFSTYFSLLSPVSLSPSPSPTPSPRPLLQTRGNDHLLQTLRSTIPRSWLTQKVRAVLWFERLCTDWRFSVMETLAVIMNCR